MSQVTREPIPRFEVGGELRASHLNRLIDAVNELTARSERESELRLKLPESKVPAEEVLDPPDEV
jgi:hypothetical protein